MEFVEKSIFLRFLIGDGKNVPHKTKTKPYKLNYRERVDVPATPPQ